VFSKRSNIYIFSALFLKELDTFSLHEKFVKFTLRIFYMNIILE